MYLWFLVFFRYKQHYKRNNVTYDEYDNETINMYNALNLDFITSLIIAYT